MKPYLKWIPLAAAVLGMGALFGTKYFTTHNGIVIVSPSTGAVTGHWNGTNGILTAAHFLGDGSGLTGVGGLGDPAVITSHLADNATNVAFIVTTSSQWTDPDEVLVSYENNGIEFWNAQPLGTVNHHLMVPATGTDGTGSAYGYYLDMNPNGYAGDFPVALSVFNNLSSTTSFTTGRSIIYGGTGAYGADIGVEWLDGTDHPADSEATAAQLIAQSNHRIQVGSSALAEQIATNQVSIASASVTIGEIAGHTNVAVYGSLVNSAKFSSRMHDFVESVSLFDNWGTSTPLAVGRLNGSIVYQVGSDGSIAASGTVSANNLYSTNDCSALTFTDRSRSPTNTAEAYDIVASHKTKDGKVDHSALHKSAWGNSSDGKPEQSSRDLSMVVSAQQMVIQDLISRIEKLEKK